MPARHTLALASLGSQEADLQRLIAYMKFAVDECVLSKVSYKEDPAVLLLASQFSFVTNADTITKVKFQSLVKICEQENENDLAIIQSPKNIN